VDLKVKKPVPWGPKDMQARDRDCVKKKHSNANRSTAGQREVLEKVLIGGEPGQQEGASDWPLTVGGKKGEVGAPEGKSANLGKACLRIGGVEGQRWGTILVQRGKAQDGTLSVIKNKRVTCAKGQKAEKKSVPSNGKTPQLGAEEP